MDAWAAQVAIDEAYMDTWDMPDEGAAGQLESVAVELNEALDAFDLELRARQDLLCIAAETPLLKNWRSLLHPAYGECLPWWLDGTLEAVAKQVEEKVIASQPSAEASRKVRDAAQRERSETEDSPLKKLLATTFPSRSGGWAKDTATPTALAAKTEKEPDQPQSLADRTEKELKEPQSDNITGLTPFETIEAEGIHCRLLEDRSGEKIYLDADIGHDVIGVRICEKPYDLHRVLGIPGHEHLFEIVGAGLAEIQDLIAEWKGSYSPHRVEFLKN